MLFYFPHGFKTPTDFFFEIEIEVVVYFLHGFKAPRILFIFFEIEVDVKILICYKISSKLIYLGAILINMHKTERNDRIRHH